MQTLEHQEANADGIADYYAEADRLTNGQVHIENALREMDELLAGAAYLTPEAQTSARAVLSHLLDECDWLQQAQQLNNPFELRAWQRRHTAELDRWLHPER